MTNPNLNWVVNRLPILYHIIERSKYIGIGGVILKKALCFLAIILLLVVQVLTSGNGASLTAEEDDTIDWHIYSIIQEGA